MRNWNSAELCGVPRSFPALSETEAQDMTEKEQATSLMDKFIDLQRIKTAGDREKEIDYQIKTTKAKLEALGIVTTDLNIDAD